MISPTSTSAGCSIAKAMARAIAVLRVAFERWIGEANDRDLPHLIAEALDQIDLFASRE
jgi:hypothetical protein